MDNYRIQFIEHLKMLKPDIEIHHCEIKEACKLLSNPSLLECWIHYRQDDRNTACRAYFYPTQESIQEKAEDIARKIEEKTC